MLDAEFQVAADLVRAATSTDHAQLERAVDDLLRRLEALVEPDLYTEGARDGARDAVLEFTAALRQADTVPRFLVARRRYFAHGALWALHDELSRQCQTTYRPA